MHLSYWEIKEWLDRVDFTVIGSGIVGLNCALALRKKYPKSKILVLEKGILPQGASTKNAGFACFGSVSELLDDLKEHSEEQVTSLVEKRWTGLRQLRSLLGDDQIGYRHWGGYELFPQQDQATFEDCREKIPYLNELLFPLFKEDVYSLTPNKFQFEKTGQEYIFNAFEGQLDTGKMMQSLLQKCVSENIRVLNTVEVKAVEDLKTSVAVKTNYFEMRSGKVLIATNGFASTLTNEDVKPARAQVLITKAIKDLKIKGTFHLDRGYYYFRNIDDRILLGGGRNLDIKGETTTEFANTEQIQSKLESLLREVILPQTAFEIDHRWSGIMGVSTSKSPVIKPLSDRVFCGVRLGGMGVAIGTQVGHELASLVD
ncbi:FAD-dependent oxidoreductase [Leptobacterium flavescens]|uniref:FAD-dependent oxidoreductase n=1 Tax=Leptobacterium flavescens TaxID=472055 RepID=A0A6P0UR70_9FLAO|nr:FAD-binding oxidoreductase [Leptobacterium flavescens]NER14259.1 FAD-dependent oxidoreductase [Leptobacterium flavescens]